MTRLETYIFPDNGNKDVMELDTGDLLIPIKKVKSLGYLEVATRVKQYLTSILRYTVQQQLIRYNPAYDLEGSIQKPETEHRPALALEKIPLLIERINAYKGRRITTLTLQLSLLVFVPANYASPDGQRSISRASSGLSLNSGKSSKGLNIQAVAPR